MKLKYIYLIVFACVGLCSKRGTEKKEEPEQIYKTSTSENQPAHINKTFPQTTKPDRLRRLPGKERNIFESGSYGSPSTEGKNLLRLTHLLKSKNFY